MLSKLSFLALSEPSLLSACRASSLRDVQNSEQMHVIAWAKVGDGSGHRTSPKEFEIFFRSSGHTALPRARRDTFSSTVLINSKDLDNAGSRESSGWADRSVEQSGVFQPSETAPFVLRLTSDGC